MNWTPEIKAELKRRLHSGERPIDIRRAMNLTPGELSGFKTRENIHPPASRRRNWNPNHPAIVDGRTLFPTKVMSVDVGDSLKPAQYQSKIGNRVTKGAWKGMRIFALTLEERKTCPRSCKLWDGCYGNNMHHSRRMQHGAPLEIKLWRELSQLQRQYSRGFVVRLHILGDFYSVGYVEFWREAIDAFPALRVFGYTARQFETPIGRAIAGLRTSHWDRFAVRTSGAASGPRTMVIDAESDLPADVILCPAQTNATRSCATCSLCWASKKPVAFLHH